MTFSRRLLRAAPVALGRRALKKTVAQPKKAIPHTGRAAANFARNAFCMLRSGSCWASHAEAALARFRCKSDCSRQTSISTRS
jgi:hypothetical protein